jgi:pimeloyl-ACP methyl ester carboxylesterase
LGGYDLREQVARITGPVLLLYGEGDPFGQEVGQATRSALASARVTWVGLRGCGHFWQETPQRFFDELRAFLGLTG